MRLSHLVFLLCVLGGCSVYMEATRPTPVDLDQYTPGDSRTSVMEKFGAPVTTSRTDGTSCDLYLLYVKGYGTAGKVPIAVLESAADFFTIGLAEVVLSPTEAVTRNEKRPVWFCYRDDQLVSVTVKQAEAEQSATATATESPQPVSAPTASSTPALAPAENPTATGVATPASSSTASATPTPTAPSAVATSSKQ